MHTCIPGLIFSSYLHLTLLMCESFIKKDLLRAATFYLVSSSFEFVLVD